MSTDGQPFVVEGSARAFQRDIYFYWSSVRASPLSLTKAGRLYQRDLRVINDSLLSPQQIEQCSEPDVPRLLFMRLLLTDLGLLERNAFTIQAREEPTFFALEATERVGLTLAHWRDGRFWNELNSVPGLTIRGIGSRLDTAPQQIVDARSKVVAQIAKLHTLQAARSTWTSIARLMEQIHTDDYEFLLPREYLAVNSSYYFRYQSYLSHASPYISYGNAMGWSFLPPIDDEADGWHVVEAGFIRALLLEPMYWMGLLDIGLLDGSPVAYRLTPIGAWALGIGPEVEVPQEGGRVVVQPNFELFALDPISDLVLAKLDKFAERVQSERAIKYRLTRKSVYGAQKQGWSVDQIITALQELSRDPNSDPSAASPLLPQNVARTLHEWQSLHERVTIHRRASLLQATDGDLLTRFIQDPAVRKHLASDGGGFDSDSSLAIVSPALGAAEELARALERAGYPPLRTRSPRDTVRPALILDETKLTPSGIQVDFDVSLPSIYLLEQIAPLTRRDERGDYYLTPTSIEEAVEQGIPIQEILGRLRALHRGPLPHKVEKQIRAWGHYFGDAALETLALIQVRDAKTLNELLAEPEIRTFLRPFLPDPEQALATVALADVEKLNAILADYGIALRDRLVQASLQSNHDKRSP